MTGEPSARVRRRCETDAGEVLAAFQSDADMARQGDVLTLAVAEAYVSGPWIPTRHMRRGSSPTVARWSASSV